MRDQKSPCANLRIIRKFREIGNCLACGGVGDPATLRRMMGLGALSITALPPRLSHILCASISPCFHIRTIAYTRSKKFPMNGSYNDPVLRQHELLEEHMSPKFYPGDITLDEEFRKCEDDEKPFLLLGRENLLTKYNDAPLKRWVEGVVPARGMHSLTKFYSLVLSLSLRALQPIHKHNVYPRIHSNIP